MSASREGGLEIIFLTEFPVDPSLQRIALRKRLQILA